MGYTLSQLCLSLAQEGSMVETVAHFCKLCPDAAFDKCGQVQL